MLTHHCKLSGTHSQQTTDDVQIAATANSCWRRLAEPLHQSLTAVSGAAVAGAAAVYFSGKSTQEVANVAVDAAKEAKEELQQLVNWSGTHNVRPKRFYQPETTEEVEAIVQKSHDQG